MKKKSSDAIEQHIIHTLARNSRTPFLHIAKELRLSEGAIRKRVARMQQEGKIRQFTIDYPQRQTAFFLIEAHKDVWQALTQHCTVYEVTGAFQYVCTASSARKEDLTALIDALHSIAGVDHVEILPVSKKS